MSVSPFCAMKRQLFGILTILTLATTLLHAQETPAPAEPETTTEEAAATPTPAVDKEPIDLFEALDYDEETDTHYEPGTKIGYTGPVYVMSDDGTYKEAEGYLKDGHEEGWWIEYYPDGTKSSEGAYKAGTEVGYWTYWHENGQWESGGEYRDGSPEGLWITFFENGKKDSEGRYRDGLMDGEWLFYDETDGKPVKMTFDKGVQLK